MTELRSLVVCPNCERLHGGAKGVNILGRIEPDGGFLILRFHAYKTIIYGDNFTVVCGNCNEQVYIHTERREGDLNNGTVGIYRTALVGTIIKNAESQGTTLGTVN